MEDTRGYFYEKVEEGNIIAKEEGNKLVLYEKLRKIRLLKRIGLEKNIIRIISVRRFLKESWDPKI